MVQKEDEKTLEKSILDEINKTGFVSELKIGSILSKAGWNTFPCFSYMDKDEGKSREIDMIASKIEYDEFLDFNLYVDLVIEVKKSDSKHWVVFTVPKSNISYGWSIIHGGTNYIKNVQLFNNEYDKSIIFNDKHIDSSNPKYSLPRVGKAFHEFSKSEKDKSQIYGSLISASKAAIYHRDLFYKQDQNADYNENQNTTLSLYLPVVVFDGKLFEVFNNAKGEIELKGADYIPIEMQYSSPNYNSFGFYETFQPDLVTIDYLPTYLKNIESWISQMWEGFKSDFYYLIDTGNVKP